jgi:hypothetical protein
MWCKHLNKDITIGKNFESECDKCSEKYVNRKYMLDKEDEDEDYNYMDPYSMKDQFLYDYHMSKKQMLIIVINRPDSIDAKEVIINSSDLDSKMDYYREAYDEDLKLKRNNEVFIEKYMFV